MDINWQVILPTLVLFSINLLVIWKPQGNDAEFTQQAKKKFAPKMYNNKKLNQYQLGCVFDITKNLHCLKNLKKKSTQCKKNHKCYEKW